jgi:arylsulfatase A-like enzyme
MDEYLTDRDAEEAVQFIREQKGKPFFLNLWHYAVHTPIEPKEQWHSHFMQKSLPGNELHPGYAAMISSVDEALGRILATLDEEGLLERTLVILTSDNGGHTAYTANKPWRSGKGNPWEGGLRVPQVFFWPDKIEANSTFTGPVSSIDLLPTLCYLAGLDPELTGNVDGLNLIPAIRGEAPLEREALYWHFPHYRAYEDVRPYSIIRKGSWKLILEWEGSNRLYDLASDPAEQTDLSEKKPGMTQELVTELKNWLNGTNALLPRINPEWAEDVHP